MKLQRIALYVEVYMSSIFEKDVMLIKVVCEVLQRELKDKHYKIEAKPNSRGLFTEVTFRYTITPNFKYETTVNVEKYRPSGDGYVEMIRNLIDYEQAFRIQVEQQIKELKTELDKIFSVDERRYEF